jgi:uncharacterized repeat protein (TIGR03803 family)
MSKINWIAKACGIFLLWATAALVTSAQTFTTLASFDGANGESPYYVSLVQGTDGNFYGTTFYGGAHEVNGVGGTVFKIAPDGTLTTVYSFCDNCGWPEGPFAGVTLGADGNFYGTTRDGGTTNSANCFWGDCGTVFEVGPEGVLHILHSFTGADDGSAPLYALIQGTDGNFYGTTSTGAAGSGTIFRITPGGSLTTLYQFPLGTEPLGALVQASDGNFYGVTPFTVYQITPAGAYTTVYTFSGNANGIAPIAGLVQGTDGNLYGTTSYGGLYNANCGNGCGTVFKITLQGVLTTLLSFDGTDGAYSASPLIQATDGNFYGMTLSGGTGDCYSDFGNYGCGTIFKITPAGVLSTLYDFTQSGGNEGGLLQATNGEFYGTTEYGGTYQEGTVFSLNVGLGQFVETLPPSGKIGATVKILGSFLTGATSVTFNGTPATFTVNSKSEIITTVPTGATTGTVQVVSPRLGTLSSNVPFRVN